MKTIKIDGKRYSISEERLTSLKEELTHNSRWVPESDDNYYFVDNWANVVESRWDNDTNDIFLLSQDNVFRTEEEAGRHLSYLKALAVLKEDAEHFVPDWKDGRQAKWSLSYDIKKDKFSLGCCFFSRSFGVYFPTGESLEKSLKVHEKEWRILFNEGCF